MRLFFFIYKQIFQNRRQHFSQKPRPSQNSNHEATEFIITYINFKNCLNLRSKRQVGTSLASSWTINMWVRIFKDMLPSSLVSSYRYIYPSSLKMQAANFSTKLLVITSLKTVVLLMMIIIMIHLRMWLFHYDVSS